MRDLASTLRAVPRAGAALALLLSGCVGSGELTPRISGQVVGTGEVAIGPGVVLVEAGEVHDGAYVVGGNIDESGRFSIDLPGAGRYGLHLFVDGYQYLPAQIEVTAHQQIVLTSPMISWGVWMDLSGQHSWPTQPDDATLTRMPIDESPDDNPVLEGVSLSWNGDIIEVSADVSDPNDDLSRMVLMWDETTHAGYALVAPGAPGPRNNFPQGTWTTSFFADEAHIPGESVLRFVVSDNLCNDTSIAYVPLPER